MATVFGCTHSPLICTHHEFRRSPNARPAASSPPAMACRLSKDWLRSKDVVSIIDAFLKPLPRWPPQLLAVCPAAYLRYAYVQWDGGEDCIRYPDQQMVFQQLRVEWTDPYFARWEAWHGRRWPKRGLFLLNAEELEALHDNLRHQELEHAGYSMMEGLHDNLDHQAMELSVGRELEVLRGEMVEVWVRLQAVWAREGK